MKKTKQLTRLARLLVLFVGFISPSMAVQQVFAFTENVSSRGTFAGVQSLASNTVSAEEMANRISRLDNQNSDGENFIDRLPEEGATLVLIFIMLLLLVVWHRWRIKNLYLHAQSLARLVQERTQALQQANIKLEQLACVDVLTNTCNRRQFIVHAEREFERFYRNQRHFSVLRAEIDNFQGINESYGFACGDYVLAEVACMLKHCLRSGDILARWGGKEFIILLPETTLTGAEVAGRKVCQVILAADFCYQNRKIVVTLSLGGVQIELGESLDTCVQRAEKALTLACEHGGGQVVAASALPRVQSRKKICHHYG
ncbi:GGDEF domain-containing protein [Thalassomonas viridans]|uniref:diguanylate cyclase n=1 Tax=Thalassomonas viridans TaxID=137584 RepID=A0AAE9Z681_9GAMM|nr:GGDEF domain-containing protein [Thalassomonas viridans]WDE06785.1 GGDEF domain-containing protein [Thalassomonas viridans]